MKKRKNIRYLIALFSFLFLSIHLLPSLVSAAIIEDEVVIDRYPEAAIFKLENMKPGDFAFRTLLIQNNHDINIQYTMQLTNQGKDDKLYNELLLQITYLDEVVFYGKLKDYTGVIDRPLDAESQEVVEFDLKFPEELGNQFQGLVVDFSLDFTAKATEESGLVNGISRGTRGTLPGTATNIFTYLIIGGTLLAVGGTASYLSRRNNPINNQ